MASALTIHRSTVGMKALVALTGLIMFGFLIVHMAGNLLILLGYEAFNGYAHTIKSNAPLLWGTRIVLTVSVVLHIALTVRLATRNSGARTSRYHTPKGRRDQVTSYAARTMVWSGPILAAYILFHLAHFTVPGLDLGGEFSAANAYGNFIRGFRVPWVAAIYIVANLMLGLHLFHGAWSALQSLGASHPRYDGMRKRAAIGVALLITAGNVFLPSSVFLRLVGTDAQLAASDAHPLGAPDVGDTQTGSSDTAPSTALGAEAGTE